MRRIFAAALIMSALSAVHVSAQVNPYKDGMPGVTGYRSEVLSEVIVQENKFIRVAEAVPADKFSWRPAEGVRSQKFFCTSAERTITCTKWSDRTLLPVWM